MVRGFDHHAFMQKADPEFRSFRDGMARVGEFLFRWSALEQQLTASIRATSNRLTGSCPPVRGGFPQRLDLWVGLASELPENRGRLPVASAVREQALVLRDVRNLIVHGILACSTMPRSEPAHIRCAVGGYEEPDSDTICYTLDELEEFAQGVDACRRAFMRLDYFNYELPRPGCHHSRYFQAER